MKKHYNINIDTSRGKETVCDLVSETTRPDLGDSQEQARIMVEDGYLIVNKLPKIGQTILVASRGENTEAKAMGKVESTIEPHRVNVEAAD